VNAAFAMTNPAPKHESQSLRQTRTGERVRVERIEGQPSVCHRLREMGFCETAEVRVINNSGALLCQVCGARVCLSAKLAESIFVAPIALPLPESTACGSAHCQSHD